MLRFAVRWLGKPVASPRSHPVPHSGLVPYILDRDTAEGVGGL
ncbi:hypothetical protein [Nonomuraea jiangxiensis]|uniref:Uncharacterized protein n=1 Tax=Nonomuraea jiangxiensis TaxID=633440 RepID=A0A1G9EIQ6_9ACTN|nr:hypothetical protein [Nonomuraea jiangxiensis]SDK75915.1 hypothetical protein SAMN05421869_118176 [Nonomuraea jiangxiensis]